MMLAYKDSKHEGNSVKYHTGKSCIEAGCSKPAGTFWSPAWCFEHNVQRMDRISASLANEAERARFQALVQKETETLRNWAGDMHRTIKAMVLAAGGEVTIRNADKDRQTVSESTQYGKDTTTYQIRV